MSILNQIKQDQLQARKDRDADKTKLLTTLYSEAANIGLNDGKRESTDKEVVKVINKFIGSIEETFTKYKFAGDPTQLLAEKAILQSYLPTPVELMTSDQLRQCITNIIADNDVTSIKQMGVVMTRLKAEYDGLYDGKVANGIVKEMLS